MVNAAPSARPTSPVRLSPAACALARALVEAGDHVRVDPDALDRWLVDHATVAGAAAEALALEVIALALKVKRVAGASGAEAVAALDDVANALLTRRPRAVEGAPDRRTAAHHVRWTGGAAAPHRAPVASAPAPSGTFTLASVAPTLRELRPRARARPQR